MNKRLYNCDSRLQYTCTSSSKANGVKLKVTANNDVSKHLSRPCRRMH
jgi:hypothetical protein